MYTVTVARKNPSMGYLRIDTSAYVDESEACQHQTGLLTPLSAACDGRKSSIASSTWSFVSHPSDSGSHAPSLTSIWSSQEPVTPPPHGMHMDMSLVASDGSFENISLGQDLNASKGIFDVTPGTLLSSPSDQIHFDSHSPDNWVGVSNQSDSQDLRLPFCTMDSMMPASGDLSTALGVSHFQQQAAMLDCSVEQESSCNAQWSLQKFTTPHDIYPSLAHQSYQADSILTGQIDPSWPPPTSSSWLHTSINVDTSTIVPTEMSIEGHVISHMHNFPIHDIQIDQSSSSNHLRTSESPRTLNAKNEVENSDKEDLFSQDSEIRASPRSTLGSSPSGKGIVKKERKHLTRSRKRNRNQMTEEYTRNLHGNVVDVRHMHSQQKKKKFVCKFVDIAGKPCHAPFEREEHLKRHKAIHSGEKPFKCVLPAGYKCDKYFNRRDNLRDHYKTHLSTAKAGRNPRVNFENFYDLLRDIEEPDEAEKTIRMLEKWRANGKHLKEEHHPRCQQ